MATSKVLKPRRGSTAEHATFKGQAFEITFDTDKKTLVMHDGLTMGGFPLAHESSVAETDSALRALIDQKVSEVEGVTSSDLQSLDSALRGFINSNSQQLAAKDADQDNVITALDSTLRALIAQEVAKYLPLLGGTMQGRIETSVDDAIRGSGPNGVFIVSAENTTTGDKLFFGIGANGTRRGIWDASANAWLVFFEEDENVLRTKDGTVITSNSGTFTGDVRLSAYQGRIRKTDTSGNLILTGGTALANGASIHLFGIDDPSENKGSAFFSSVDADENRHYLKYNPNGCLEDDWNPVLTIEKSFQMRYFSGTQVTVPSGGTWDAFIVSANDNTDYCSGGIYKDVAGGTVLTMGAVKNAAIFIKKKW